MPAVEGIKYNPKNSNSVQNQLDQVLDKLENVDQDQKIEQQVFASKPEELNTKPKLPKPKVFKDLAWYWEIIKKPIFVLAGLEIITYILSIIPDWKELMLEIINPLLLIPYFVIFALVMIQVKRKYKETLWQGIVTAYLAGFGMGFIVAIFKAFWIREFWTIFNLITEPVFMGLVAAIIGLIIGLFIKRKKI